MKRNQISLLLSSLVISASILAGCNSGTSSAGSSTATETATEVRQSPVGISPMAAIPLTGVGHQFTLRISNSSANDYSLDKIEVIDPLTGRSALDKVSVNRDLCEKVAKNSYCAIKITPQVDKSAAFIIKATLSANGKQEVVSQLIRISDKVKSHNSIYFTNDISEVVADKKSNYTLALPVVLDDDFSAMKVSNGLLDCEGKSKGSSCTYILNGSISADKTLVATNIEGTHKKDGTKEQLLKSNTLVRANMNYTKVLLSQPADIVAKKDGSAHDPVSVIAYNLGNVAATDINVKTSVGFSATNTCGTELGGGTGCAIPVSVTNSDEQVSVSGSLTFEYNRGKSASTQLFYDALNLDTKLELTPKGNPDFNSMVIGDQPRTAIYTLTNSGDKTLTGIQIRLDAPDFSHSLCPSALASGETCDITVTYNPQAVNSGNTNLAVTGKYTTKEGQTTTDKTIYAATPITYSALNAFTSFKVSPELGHNFVAKTGTSVSHDYTITNVSNYASTLSAAKVSTNVASTAGEFTLDKGCETTLNANGGSCKLGAIFAPKVDHNIKDIAITVPASGPNGSAGEDLELKANLFSKADAADAPNITVVGPIVFPYEGNLGGSFVVDADDMFAATRISFGMFSGRKVSLHYTFENKGPGAANNFNVAVSGISSSFAIDIDNTNCPIGETSRVFAKDDKCDVSVNIPKEKYFAAGMLNGADFTDNLVLPYSYENLATTTYEEKTTNPVEVKISTNVAEGLTLTPKMDGNNVILDVEHAGLNKLVSKTDTEITVSATIKGIPDPKLSCDVAAGSLKECTVLKLPASFPKGEHSLDVTITPKSDANLKQHRVVKFTV
ncbi:choice-of-anchor D domain-containing protein [Aquella oligotrophica]|uniref:Choice-of-anchor D domain-containing protein n=1 Tax=Aquella oligotrophica TaxID=2067065 RepID=A0A2I7N642_9NEIS|nr:choice-of-anchor D domain-containing protein [Aquella oligotrophica]AUR51928.1 hypothetical protein CUN60_06330 [Aquella oligotrophica]